MAGCRGEGESHGGAWREAQPQEVTVRKDAAIGSTSRGTVTGGRAGPQSQEKERGPSVHGWQTLSRWQQDAS